MNKYLFFVAGIIVTIAASSIFGKYLYDIGLDEQTSIIVTMIVSFLISWYVSGKFYNWKD